MRTLLLAFWLLLIVLPYVSTIAEAQVQTHLASNTAGSLDNNRLIYIDKITPAGTLTLSEDSVLRFAPGGSLEIPSGQTVTIKGTIEAGFHQIFRGEGKVKGLITAYPEWFGAKGDGVTDDTRAVQSAVNAITSTNPEKYKGATYSKTLKLTRSHYRISQPLIIPESIGVTIEGVGPGMGYSTIIQWNGTEQPDSYMLDARSVLGFTLRNLTFIGQSETSSPSSACIGNGIITGRTATYFNSQNVWENVSVIRFPGVGLTFGRYSGFRGGFYPADTGQTDNSIFTNLHVWDCKTGIVINSPNFLQCYFNRLLVGSYGGNPLDPEGNPVENLTAAPIKFRTKNAVRLMYGSLVGSAIHLYAPFSDSSPESQYALYVLDGSFTIQSGYSESKYFAYVENGANKAGGTHTKSVNSISNFDLYSGAAGGPDTPGKYPIHYAQELVPLALTNTDGIWVFEAANSAGVLATGCRTENQFIASQNLRTKKRNPKSTEIACSYLQSESGTLRWSTGTRIGQSASINSNASGETIIANDLIPIRLSKGVEYRFQAGTPDTTSAAGLVIDKKGIHYFNAKGLSDGSSFDSAKLVGKNTIFAVEDNEKNWPTINLQTNETGTKNRIAFSTNGAPKSGKWSRGDLVYNAVPVAGGNVGWICLEGGIPGKWKAFGQISTK